MVGLWNQAKTARQGVYHVGFGLSGLGRGGPLGTKVFAGLPFGGPPLLAGKRHDGFGDILRVGCRMRRFGGTELFFVSG